MSYKLQQHRDYQQQGLSLSNVMSQGATNTHTQTHRQTYRQTDTHTQTHTKTHPRTHAPTYRYNVYILTVFFFRDTPAAGHGGGSALHRALFRPF
jgi:hypothetical protein